MNNEQLPQFKQPPSGNSETGTSAGEAKLSIEQRAAIQFSAKIGRKIQQDCPEIARDYINGASLSELAIKYDIQKKFGVANLNTASVSISNALKGYSGKLSDSYPGLITDPKILKDIENEHKKKAGERIGKLLKEEGRGIFGMTKEDKSQVSGRAGMDLYQTGKGIHAQTFEERSAQAKENVRRKGFIPFSNEEEAFMRSLDLSKAQYRTRGTKVNAKKIAQEINEKFHNGNDVRSSNAVSTFFRIMKGRNAPTN